MNKEHFLTFVEILDNGCWKWVGGSTPNGYGKLGVAGKTVSAHRYSYEIFKGPIPEGLLVLHKCQKPLRLCVNPAHLKAGTYKENLDDALKTNGRIGALPIYSSELIVRIFQLRSQLKSSGDIARELELSIDYISQVLFGKVRPELRRAFEQKYGKLPNFNANYRFSDEDVAEMHRLHRSELWSSVDIAKQFKTSYKYVWKVLKGKSRPLQREGDIP